jgi:hypothetical protein
MRLSPSVWIGTTAVAAIVGMAAFPAPSLAWPDFLQAWQARYPTSTLPQRMSALTGSQCNVCHTPPNRFDIGTCYRLALRDQLNLNLTIEQALEAVHNMDPDGDGVPSGVEILMPRSDAPGQIGYHPGLVGPGGRDPCAVNPSNPVTGQSETPAAACYPNCDGSTVQPVLNVDDFTCFINEFALGQSLPPAQQVSHYANCDGSTIAPVLNVDDFTCFINEFALGCR